MILSGDSCTHSPSRKPVISSPGVPYPSVRSNYAILIGEADFSSGSLRQESNVRPTRIFTADKRIIPYTAGHLNDQKMTAVVDRIVEIIQE